MPSPSPSSQGPFNPSGVATYWIGNAAQVPQVDSITVTSVPGAGGATLVATINGKVVSYLTLSTDTTSTAAAAWQALLSSQSAPPEFGEITFTVTNNVITATGPASGAPFSLATSVGGTAGAAVSHAVVLGTSPNHADNPVNWIRNGIFQVPQDGDDVVVSDSSVPLLYNLNYFVSQGTRFNSFTRWQSFTGTVGLPENNPLGYYEYRPTYFAMTGPGTGVALPVRLGQGQTGSGPTRERYNFGSQQFTLDAVAAGAAQDDFGIRILGTNPANVLRVLGSGVSVGVAMLPGETAALTGPSYVAPGATLALGGVNIPANANITCNGGTLYVACPASYTLTVENGGTLTLESSGGLLQKALTVLNGSRATWNADTNLTTLALQTGSVFDKSGDPRTMTITNSSMDGNCQINDPYNAITYTATTSVRDAVTGGPFLTGPNRNIKLS